MPFPLLAHRMGAPSRLLTLLCALAAGCAHLPRSAEELKPAVERFHQQLRWRDYRGLSTLVVPERRQAFEQAVQATHADKDLEVTDYEIQDAKLSPDARRAVVISHLNWHRLPSVTEHEDTVTSEYVYLGGAWLVARMDPGPFAGVLAAPYVEGQLLAPVAPAP